MTSWTVLVDSPAMLYADVSGETVTVYVSSIVREDGTLYRPVADFLDGKDYSCSEEVLSDEHMMWGEAKLRTYELS